ncbi:2-hydroxyacid dehydrogenase [Paenibacillus sp. CAU 1782]
MKPYIFSDRPLPDNVKAYLMEHSRLDVWEGKDTLTREELHARLAEANGFLTAGRRVDKELLAAAPKLQAVSTVSVGYNHFAIEDMLAAGVVGTHTPYVLDDSVADLVLALMLSSARRVAELDRHVREGKWKRGDGDNLFGIDVHHGTAGIIGMGRIGEAVARRAALGFGMKVLYHNRSRRPHVEANYGAAYATLEELLQHSDFVIMLAPLTEDTKGLLGAREFAMMKPSTILINASRGATLDEDALIDALERGVIRGAGLDVFEREPLPQDSRLVKLDNVVLLPHIGSATTKTRTDMAMLAAENLVSALKGETPSCLIPEFKS